MKKQLYLVATLILVLAFMSSCATPTAAPAAPAAPAEPVIQTQIVEITSAPVVETQVVQVTAPAAPLQTCKIGFSFNRFDSVLLKAWQDYMESYSAQIGPSQGLNFVWTFNVADGDVSRQASNIQDLLNAGNDVIVARAEDASAIGASAKAVMDAGKPFVTFDRASSGYQPTLHVGADSYTQAVTTATTFADILKKNNVQNPQCIELEGDLKDQNAVFRSQGWHDVENQTHAWKTIVQVPTEWDANKFYTGTANALQAHPEANCMFVASDFAFQAVEKALQEAGKLAPTGDPKHIWMAAQDVNPPGLEGLEKGYIDVVTSYDAYYHATTLVDALVKLCKNEPLGVAKLLVPGRVVTQDNYKTMPNLWARDYANVLFVTPTPQP
jgi:ribose transport system substrate-binding protein